MSNNPYCNDSLPREHRLSPRCILTSSPSSSVRGYHSPFGSSLNHSRQSSIISNQSSTTSNSFLFCNGSANSSLNHIPPPPYPSTILSPSSAKLTTNLHQVSPTSLDMGYHTMLNNGIESWDDSSSPVLSTENISTNENFVELNPERVSAKFKANTIHSIGFQDLSDELILKIFSYLSTNTICMCARVSRRFYFLAWDPRLWNQISLSGEKLNADLALMTLLRLVYRDNVHSNSGIEKIILNGCSRLTDSGLIAIARKCPDLISLDLKRCRLVSNEGVREIITQCQLLSNLHISGCGLVSSVEFRPSEPSPATAAMLGVPPAPSRTLNLQIIDLTDCTRMTDQALISLIKSSPCLNQLYLRRCLNITDYGIKNLPSYCLSLKELSLSDCVKISDCGLFELAKLGPNLRYLSVAKCHQITDKGIKQIAKLCYKLRYLNIRGCEMVSDEAIECISKSCSRLRSLDIGKCDVTDIGLKLLAENCPNLKKISIKSCEMITDCGIQYLAHNCRGLQQLNIQDCHITLEGYRTVKKYCRRCIIEHTNPGFF